MLSQFSCESVGDLGGGLGGVWCGLMGYKSLGTHRADSFQIDLKFLLNLLKAQYKPPLSLFQISFLSDQDCSLLDKARKRFLRSGGRVNLCDNCLGKKWDLLRLWKSSLERGDNPSAEDFFSSTWSLFFTSSLLSPHFLWPSAGSRLAGPKWWPHMAQPYCAAYWTTWPRVNLWIYVIIVFHLEGHDWNTRTKINSSSFSLLGSYIFKITQEHILSAQSLKASC